MSDTQTPHAPGDTLGRYRIAKPMGSGGMGRVYEAWHLDLDKRVALKVLHPDVAQNPVARARFLREGQVAARIHHPNVVEVFDVGHEDGVIFLVMEYLDGEDLAERLGRTGRMNLDALCDLMLPVCLAVAAAHEAGVVHRDLKPENIFLARTRDGFEPKLLDFGISKVPQGCGATTGLTQEFTALGTPQYMSPEQATRSSQVDARSDLYTLGLILYECAVGKRAFDGTDVYPVLNAVVGGAFTPPREVISEIPESFEAVVLRAMALDPAARYADALSLGRELLPFASPAGRARFARRFVLHDPDKTQVIRALTDTSRVMPSTLRRMSLEIPIALSTRRRRARAHTVWILGAIAATLVLAAVLVPARGAAPLPIARSLPATDHARLPSLEVSAPTSPAPRAPLEVPASPPAEPTAPADLTAPAGLRHPATRSRPRAVRNVHEGPSVPSRSEPLLAAPSGSLPRPEPTAAAQSEPARGANNAPIVE